MPIYSLFPINANNGMLLLLRQLTLKNSPKKASFYPSPPVVVDTPVQGAHVLVGFEEFSPHHARRLLVHQEGNWLLKTI